MKTSSKFYEESLKSVLSFYGIALEELDDWSCCGASAAPTIDEQLMYILSARNLAIAEEAGYPLFVPCSACYNRCVITNVTMKKDRARREEINGIIHPLHCTGTVHIHNIIEVLHDYVGIERIAKEICYDLSSITVVPYYGCVLTRMMNIDTFDDKEDPTSMDSLLWACGVRLTTWPYKMECCGAAKTFTTKEITYGLSGKIMDMALSLHADAIVTPCPLCQMNLDLLPYLGRKEENLPVLFLTEIYELALFGTLKGKESHIIPVEKVIQSIKGNRSTRT